MLIICNVLCDYCEILNKRITDEELEGYAKAHMEYYIDRCKSIYNKLSSQMGYDRDKALEKCRKNRSKKQPESDIGEDALTLMVKGKKRL